MTRLTGEKLLLVYLNAAATYGPRAGQVDEQYCREVLDLAHPRKAVEALAKKGYPVKYDREGAIVLKKEVSP